MHYEVVRVWPVYRRKRLRIREERLDEPDFARTAGRVAQRWMCRWERRHGMLAGGLKIDLLRDPGDDCVYLALEWRAVEPRPGFPEDLLRQGLNQAIPPYPADQSIWLFTRRSW